MLKKQSTIVYVNLKTNYETHDTFTLFLYIAFRLLSLNTDSAGIDIDSRTVKVKIFITVLDP